MRIGRGEIAPDDGTIPNNGEPNILIIEQGLAGESCSVAFDSSVVGRYQSRVVARFRFGDDGKYVPCQAHFKIPRALYEVLHDNLGSMPFTPARFFDNDLLTDELLPRFPLLGGPPDHGDMVLSLLAEYTPRAQFVLAEPPVFDQQALCLRDFEKLNRDADATIGSLRAIIAFGNVRYVNLSAGIDRSFARRLFEQCDRQASERDVDAFINVASRIVRSLSSIDGVVMTQAVSSMPQMGDDARLTEFPIDCEATGYPNRVRVGSYNLLNSDVPKDGADFSQYQKRLKPGLRNAISCIDVAINGGFAPEMKHAALIPGPDAAEIGHVWGLIYMPIDFFTASFAAPIALGELIYLQDTSNNHQPISDDSLHLLESGRAKIRDPIHNRALQVFQYLTAEEE